MVNNNETNSMAVKDNLKMLLDILEKEKERIIKADASAISEISREKEQVARKLNEKCKQYNGNLTPELGELAALVARMASINDTLLRDLQKHYLGMVDILIRQAGRMKTYGPDGALDLLGQPSGTTRLKA